MFEKLKSIHHVIKKHIQKRTFTEEVIYPEHEPRADSKGFAEAKNQLYKDGHYKCWICGTTENLECHHYGCEFALEENCDMNSLKEYLITNDIYGYSQQLKEKPIENCNDVRNMMILCTKHHRLPYFGIHNTTYSSWIMQKLCKQGDNPLVDENK